MKDRTVFGIPLVLTAAETSSLQHDLTRLWTLCYGKPPGDLEADLESCRRFFDPLARGRTLRERLAQVPGVPKGLSHANYQEPLVTDAGEGVRLVGVEARLLMSVLDEKDLEEGYIFLSSRDVAIMEAAALAKYRDWCTARLGQVIALRTGKAAEVMQAVSVGLVIALLVNRSDEPTRAIPRLSKVTFVGQQVNDAIYAGAEKFADTLVPTRSERSADEKRLKGGYGLSEASRRLAHRLVITRRAAAEDLIHIESKSRDDVVKFLGHDLARRSGLAAERLSEAYDQLVLAFRAEAGKLAHRSMVFERSADTRDLKADLMAAFEEARSVDSRRLL